MEAVAEEGSLGAPEALEFDPLATTFDAPRPSLREIEKGVKQELESALASGGASAEREQRLRRIADLAAQFRTCAASAMSSEEWYAAQEVAAQAQEPERTHGAEQASGSERASPQPNGQFGGAAADAAAPPEVVWRPEAPVPEERAARQLRRYEAGLRRLHSIAFGMPPPEDAEDTEEMPEEPNEFDTILADVERALSVRDTKLKELTALAAKERAAAKASAQELKATVSSLKAELADSRKRERGRSQNGPRPAGDSRSPSAGGASAGASAGARAAQWRYSGAQVESPGYSRVQPVTVLKSTASQLRLQPGQYLTAWPGQHLAAQRGSTPLSARAEPLGARGASASRSPERLVGATYTYTLRPSLGGVSRSPTPTPRASLAVPPPAASGQISIPVPAWSTGSAASLAQQAAAALPLPGPAAAYTPQGGSAHVSGCASPVPPAAAMAACASQGPPQAPGAMQAQQQPPPWRSQYKV